MKQKHKNSELLKEKYWNEGLTIEEISQEWNVSSSTIYRWMKIFDISMRNTYWSEQETKFLKNRYSKIPYKKLADLLGRSESSVRTKVYELGLSKSSTSKIKKQENLSKDKAYLLGVLGPGDGWVEHSPKHYNYRIGLNAIDKEFVDKFDDCVRNVYGLRCSRNKVPAEGETKRQYLARVGSIEVFKDLLEYGSIQIFKHHTERVPDQIKLANQKIKSGYLQAFFDSQGSCDSKFRKVTASKSNPKVLEEIGNLLSDFEIEYGIHLGKEGTHQYVLTISSRENLEAFKENIGFSIERKERSLDKALDYKNESWSKQRVINELRKTAQKIGISPKIDDVRFGLVHAARRYFGSWNGAKEAAGLPVLREITASEEIDKLVPRMLELRSKGLTYNEIAEQLEVSSTAIWNRIHGGARCP